jgi:hypothetical protein
MGAVVIAGTIATHRRAERPGVPSLIAETLQDLSDDALHRRRLPNRRRNETHSVAIDGMRLTATVGFDGDGRPAEVFLDGAKDGSGLAAVLEDARVVISIALQHGIAAAVLATNVARMPGTIDGPRSNPPRPSAQF